MQSELLFQPFADDEALVERIRTLLTNDEIEQVTIIVAWVRPSGLRLINAELTTFRARGGRAEIIVGIDEGGASVEGLQMAMDVFDSVEVLYDPTGGIFHPKIYVARGPAAAFLIVGSNNLTRGGLHFNYEAAHVTTLDLGLAPDAASLGAINDYVARLRADATCLCLTPELLAQLVSDPRFQIVVESEKTNRGKKEDAPAGADSEQGPSPFGSTTYKRKSLKATPTKSTPVGGAPEVGGSKSPVLARWTKKMTKSDCGQPNAQSNTTGALRFTKANHPIKQATWFRKILFSNVTWEPDPTRIGRERAEVRFDVTIDGAKAGTHVLRLKYDAERESGQANFTTDLKWGSLTPAIISTNHVGDWVAVERLGDGSFRLVIGVHEPGSFLDNISA